MRVDKVRLPIFFTVFCCLFSFGAQTTAQTTKSGQITGQVVIEEKAGRRNPAQNVTVFAVGDFEESGTKTNKDGKFTFPSLPAGKWKLVVKAKGYCQIHEATAEVFRFNVAKVNPDPIILKPTTEPCKIGNNSSSR